MIDKRCWNTAPNSVSRTSVTSVIEAYGSKLDKEAMLLTACFSLTKVPRVWFVKASFLAFPLIIYVSGCINWACRRINLRKCSLTQQSTGVSWAIRAPSNSMWLALSLEGVWHTWIKKCALRFGRIHTREQLLCVNHDREISGHYVRRRAKRYVWLQKLMRISFRYANAKSNRQRTLPVKRWNVFAALWSPNDIFKSSDRPKWITTAVAVISGSGTGSMHRLGWRYQKPIIPTEAIVTSIIWEMGCLTELVY